MTYRFRQRVKILPGVYLNASSSGTSVTIGPRGGSINIGPRGTYVNTKIPGLPLYQREKISGPGRAAASGRPAAGRPVAALERLSEALTKRGIVAVLHEGAPQARIEDDAGEPYSQDDQALMWQYAGEILRKLIEPQIEAMLHESEALTGLHHLIPKLTRPPAVTLEPFSEPQPSPPAHRSYNWLWRLSASHRAGVDRVNASLDAIYAEDLDAWKKRKAWHEQEMANASAIYDLRYKADGTAIEKFLAWHLPHLQWPRETAVDFECSPDGSRLLLDVDLPSIDSMPTRIPTSLSNGGAIRWRELGETERRRIYKEHVHSIGLRLLGEVFAHIPSLNLVIISAYTERRSSASGALGNDYLYSAKIDRGTWGTFDFNHLDAVDPAEAFGRFELSRRMTSTGIFKPVAPLEFG